MGDRLTDGIGQPADHRDNQPRPRGKWAMLVPSRLVIVLTASIGLLVLGDALLQPWVPALLEEVYTPTFGRVPPPQPVFMTVQRLASDNST